MNEYIEMGMAEEAMMMRDSHGMEHGNRRPSSSHRRHIPSNSSSRSQSSDDNGGYAYNKRKVFASSSSAKHNNTLSTQAEGKKTRVFGNKNASKNHHANNKYAHDIDDDILPDFKWMKKTRL